MLLTGAGFLQDASGAGTAVPGFVAFNLETAQGIVTAAEETGLPVLLQAGSAPFRHAGLRPLALLALQLAGDSTARVGVHLDHSRSLDEVRTCLELGYTSVMYDGSHLPLAENIAQTRKVALRAHEAGAWVEAELGAVGGDEEAASSDRRSVLTDPREAATFVEATGVDALAVAVGNVHGLPETPPEIDLELLEEIRDATSVPLVLHGASGLGGDVLLACLNRGVAKVNVNTELRRAYLKALRLELPGAIEASDLATPLAAGRVAVTTAAAGLLRFLARIDVPSGGAL